MFSGMKIVLVLTAALLTGPAMASDCVWQSQEATAIETARGIEITYNDGKTSDLCTDEAVGSGIMVRMATCIEGWSGPIFWAPSTLGGEYLDLMILQNEVWYCTHPGYTIDGELGAEY